jgi:trk system potassium uptake protein TrkH
MEFKKARSMKMNTMQKIAFGFLFGILLGSILLWLPISNQTPIRYWDALFTSVTAVCVTGLVTVVPATQFTLFGKWVLLILIQVGGLGVIACVIAFSLFMHKKITLKERVVIQEAYNLDTLSGVVRFIRRILKGTFVVEAVGAICYAFVFVPKYGMRMGIFYAIFQSVSAFCNAGVDILGGSSYQEYVMSFLVNATTMFLIVLGGLGFPTWTDLLHTIRMARKQQIPREKVWKKLQLQTKIVLTMTGSVLAIGIVGIFVLEYHNPDTIGELSFAGKWLVSCFQAITTRTAGFATISQEALTPAAMILSSVMMFIGGSPAGTAGGVKTTTVAMLIVTVLCVVKGKKDTECFGRKVDSMVVRTGISIVFLTFMAWILGVIMIVALEPEQPMLFVMYEVSSAVSTAGLSANLTSNLGMMSQAILMVLMYIGRIGPITMALVFAGKQQAGDQIRELPEKHVMLG